MNELLVANSILPKIRFGISKTPDGKSPAGGPALEGDKAGGEGAPNTAEDMFARIAKMMGGPAGAGGGGGAMPGMGVGGVPLVVSPHLLKSMPYDPQKDLAPVVWIAAVPALMVVHPSIPAKTVPEFIKLAKSKPGQLTYSSSGNGGTGHLAGALFDLGAGTKMIHVPYKGTGPATTALVAGEVTLSFGESIALLPHIKSGRLRALAVTTLKRFPVLPELPTVAETIPGYTAGPWYGILAPAKTPADIIAKLNGAVGNILRMPDIQANLANAGAEAKGGSPADLANQIREESERWGKVIREAKIQVE